MNALDDKINLTLLNLYSLTCSDIFNGSNQLSNRHIASDLKLIEKFCVKCRFRKQNIDVLFCFGTNKILVKDQTIGISGVKIKGQRF